tara:strand:- start:554 stop:1153 length:600 start_codon:yes stop_codon:yes gene_type:complete
MKKARYIRVSTEKQKMDRQKELKSNDETLFIDIVSGSVDFRQREGGKQLYNEIVNGNINYLSVHSIDRLGRTLFNILETLKFLNENNVILKVDNLGIESRVKGKPNPAFKLIISVMANIAEMERETMLERQREGIERAKAKGNYKGRVKGSSEPIEIFLNRNKKAVELLKRGDLSLRQIAKLSDVSLGTVQKVKSIINL